MNIELSPTVSNLTTKSKLFDESSIVFGLFIGYLISGSLELPVEDYYSRSLAYYCIQGRGIAALMGVFCLAISSFVRYSLNSLLSLDLKIDTEELEQEQLSIVYLFISKIQSIQLLTYILSYVSLIIFVSGYCGEIYSVFAKELDFDVFFALVGFGTGVLLLILIYIYCLKAMAYKKISSLGKVVSSSMF